MRTIFRYIGVILICLTSYSVSANSDKCSGLLQDGVRNQFSETYDRKFIDEFHSAMCSENQQRIDKAKSTGLNIGYENFVLDFAGNNRKIAAYQTSMCSSKDRLNTGSTFYEQVRNHVSRDLVASFNECIRITEGGMEFDVREGIEGDSITIDVGYSRTRAPRAELKVTHLVVNPSNLEDKVDCKGPLADVRSGTEVLVNQPIGIQGITCRPGVDFPSDGDNDFSIILHTTVGHIEGYVKPFYKGKSDRIKELEEKYNTLKSEYSELKSVLSKIEGRLNKTGTTRSFDVMPYGNFGAKWFDLKCGDGEVLTGYGFEISPYIQASGPGVDKEGKIRVPKPFRAYCSKI